MNGLYAKITPSGPVGPLLTSNPNADNPARLTHAQALTCDQDHAYTAEQQAVDGGKMDKFVQFTDGHRLRPRLRGTGTVMDYYDGNTVTALWNYAQHYAMSDNNYDTTFGPSTPGALNLISGNDGGGFAVSPSTSAVEPDPGTVSALNGNGLGTIYGDLDPAYDDCSDASHTDVPARWASLTGKNVGDLLNAKGVTWGWFQGGFAPTGTNASGYAVCGTHAREHRRHPGRPTTRRTTSRSSTTSPTANPKHLPPSSEAADRPHRPGQPPVRPLRLLHRRSADGNLPAVSFLKAAEYQDGHPGYSDPLDEQPSW